jgi:hypothetical protein
LWPLAALDGRSRGGTPAGVDAMPAGLSLAAAAAAAAAAAEGGGCGGEGSLCLGLLSVLRAG